MRPLLLIILVIFAATLAVSVSPSVAAPGEVESRVAVKPGTGAQPQTGTTPEVSSPGELDKVMTNFQSYTQKAASSIKDQAKTLFWFLAAIEFAYGCLRLGTRGPDLGEIYGEVIWLVITIGFFEALMDNGGTWLPAIVSSFNQMGSTAVSAAAGSNVTVSPSGIMVAASKVAASMYGGMHWYTPGKDLGLFFMALVVVLLYGFVAAMLAETLIESYFCLACGAVMLGFGGSRWTRANAMNAVWYAVSVGVKLLMMDLVIAVGLITINSYANSTPNTPDGFWGVVITLMVLAVITSRVPAICQAMVTSAPSMTDGGSVTRQVTRAAMATAGVAAVGAGIAAVAGTRAGAGIKAGMGQIAEGFRQMGTSGERGQGAATAAGGVRTAVSALGAGAKSGVKSAATELAHDVGAKLTGDFKARHGIQGVRVAANMMASRTPPPKPPSGDE